MHFVHCLCILRWGCLFCGLEGSSKYEAKSMLYRIYNPLRPPSQSFRIKYSVLFYPAALNTFLVSIIRMTPGMPIYIQYMT